MTKIHSQTKMTKSISQTKITISNLDCGTRTRWKIQLSNILWKISGNIKCIANEIALKNDFKTWNLKPKIKNWNPNSTLLLCYAVSYVIVIWSYHIGLPLSCPPHFTIKASATPFLASALLSQCITKRDVLSGCCTNTVSTTYALSSVSVTAQWMRWFYQIFLGFFRLSKCVTFCLRFSFCGNFI